MPMVSHQVIGSGRGQTPKSPESKWSALATKLCCLSGRYVWWKKEGLREQQLNVSLARVIRIKGWLAALQP